VMKPDMATNPIDSRPVTRRHGMATGEILERLQGDLLIWHHQEPLTDRQAIVDPVTELSEAPSLHVSF